MKNVVTRMDGSSTDICMVVRGCKKEKAGYFMSE